MEKRIMTEDELAFYLHLTVAQVRKLRGQGMPVRYLGPSENRDGRYLLDEIVEWLKGRPDFISKKKKKESAET